MNIVPIPNPFSLKMDEGVATTDSPTFAGLTVTDYIKFDAVNDNIFIGYYAGHNTVSGGANTFIGTNSGYSHTTGDENFFLGSGAGYHNITGRSNVFVGKSAGYQSLGDFNVCIGVSAGELLTTGTHNVFIGDYAGTQQTTLDNRLIIDNQNRITAANEITNCLIYGVFDVDPANQTLRFNAAVTGTSFTGIGSGLTSVDAATLQTHNAAYFQVAGSYQSLSTNLTSIAGLTFASTSFVKMTSAGTFGLDTTTYYKSGDSPVFGNSLQILEGGITPTKHTVFQGGDQTDDITYTLPVALGAAGTVLKDVAGNGVLSWAAGGGAETDPIVGAINGIVKANGAGVIAAVSSGTDIKTVNSTSLLGSGDIAITPNATHTGDATGATALTVVALNGTNLAGLATGILKNTITTGIPTIAVAGTDYVSPISLAIYTPANGATATLDARIRDHWITMPAGNITIAVSNAANGLKFNVYITQDGTGSRLATWFTTIKWAGGTAPTLTTTASKRDAFGFFCTSASTYDGYTVGFSI